MKIIGRVFLFLLLAAFIYVIYYLNRALPILTGYGAKLLCSCVYVADRTPESVIAEDLDGFLFSLADYQLQEDDRSATGSVWGMARRKAIFREGLGCTLIAELSEEEIRDQPFSVDLSVSYDPDTLAWPLGNVMTDSLMPDFNESLLAVALDSAFTENHEFPIRTRAVAVVYRGQLIGEKYADGYDRNSRLLGWSMTKSITHALVGLLVKENRLELQAPAQVEGWSGDYNKITLDMLLRMSSGLEWNENYFTPSGATNMLFRSADMGANAASVDLAFEPDSYWYYSSGTTNIVSRIIRKTLGEARYHNFPYSALFHKIGMTTMLMEADPSGTYVGSSYSWATARDWARFGLLYLNNGQFNGEQVLPAGWAQYAATPTPASDGTYGAHFWLNAHPEGHPRKMEDVPDDVFIANGFEGQRVYIVPSHDLVVVRLGNTKYGGFDHNRFLGDVLKALPAPSN